MDKCKEGVGKLVNLHDLPSTVTNKQGYCQKSV